MKALYASLLLALATLTSIPAHALSVGSSGVVPAGGANDIDIFYTIGAGVGLVAIATGNPLSVTNMAGAGPPTDTRQTATSGFVKFESATTTAAGTTVTWNLIIDPAVTITDWYFTLNGADVSPRGVHFGPTTVVVTPTPIPAALPLFASGLLALGWIARRRKKKFAAA